MSPERWQQIEDLYAAYLEQPAAERDAFLDRACAGDASLRAEIDSLLAAEDEAPSFLETPFARLPETNGFRPGVQVGPYRILRPLGRGGMGQVYLAEREVPFRQQVALKVIRHGLDTDDLLRRFRAEQQILAGLRHPNIARLLDGGTTEDRRPYFVMEYVEGAPLTDYCDAHRLSVEARLQLFQTVCEAVHAAHRNLVVHRDLKPSNILVTDPGSGPPDRSPGQARQAEVKLLDFGIAKILDPDAPGLSVPVTRTEMRVMTPEYASPEQVRGEPVTTASDVYALGVLLYELLAGRRPYRLPSRVQEEIARVIAEEDPAKPSTAVTRIEAVCRADGSTETITPEQVSRARDASPEKLRRRLRGDLDTIVLMAMRKEPERRYASAQELAEDLRRHLAGLPVIARPDTLAYRAGTFARRHRFGVAAAALFVFVLLGFSIVTAVQSARIRAQAAETARERDKAEQVTQFMMDLFKTSDPNTSKGNTVTARELLDQGAETIETELADQPDVQAEMMGVMSEVYESLGLYPEAERLARRALQMRRRLHGEVHPEVATALNYLGWLLHMQGAYVPADSLLREALLMRRTVLGPKHLEVSRTLNDLAVVQQARGDYAAADTLLQEALAIRRRHLGNDHESVAITLNNLAALKYQQGRYEEAIASMEEALDGLRAHFGEHMRVATALLNLASFHTGNGDYSAAEPLYREALALQRRLVGDEHPSVAMGLTHLGSLLIRKRAYDEAEPLLLEALTIQQKQLGAEHPDVATSLYTLAGLSYRKEAYAEAELRYREALALRQKALGREHPEVSHTLDNLARTLHARGAQAEAEPLYREALALRQKALGPEHPYTAISLIHLADLLQEREDYRGAEPLYREVIQIRSKTLGADHWETAQANMQLGLCLMAQETYDEAEPLLQKSQATLQAQFGDEHELTRKAQDALNQLYEMTSDG